MNREFLLGLMALLCAACGEGTAAAIAVGGTTGGEVPAGPWSHALSGKLAQYPLAVSGDGQTWLLGGSFSSMGPGYPGTWANTHLWKLDPNGEILIDATIDADGFDVEPRAIRADDAGNVVILGHAFRQPGAAETMDIGGQAVSFPFTSSAFVAKLDAGGALVWAKVLDKIDGIDADGFPVELRLEDVGMDGAGRVHVAAELRGTADLGGGPVTSDDSILWILSPEGDHLADRVFSSLKTVFLRLAVEPSGDFWLARASFYGQSHVEKFDSTGASTLDVSWPVCWVDANAFARDGHGGFFSLRAEDPAEHCPTLTTQHVAASGAVEWVVEENDSYAVRPTITTSSPGHAWMSLGLEGTLDLGGSTLTGSDVGDILLAQLDEQGNVSQTASYGGPGDDEVVEIALDPSGARFVAGHFTTSIDFGQGALENASGDPRAIFLARLSP